MTATATAAMAVRRLAAFAIAATAVAAIFTATTTAAAVSAAVIVMRSFFTKVLEQALNVGMPSSHSFRRRA